MLYSEFQKHIYTYIYIIIDSPSLIVYVFIYICICAVCTKFEVFGAFEQWRELGFEIQVLNRFGKQEAFLPGLFEAWVDPKS